MFIYQNGTRPRTVDAVTRKLVNPMECHRLHLKEKDTPNLLTNDERKKIAAMKQYVTKLLQNCYADKGRTDRDTKAADECRAFVSFFKTSTCEHLVNHFCADLQQKTNEYRYTKVMVCLYKDCIDERGDLYLTPGVMEAHCVYRPCDNSNSLLYVSAIVTGDNDVCKLIDNPNHYDFKAAGKKHHKSMLELVNAMKRVQNNVAVNNLPIYQTGTRFTKNLNKLDKLFGENEDIVGRLCQTNTIRNLMKQFLNKCQFVNPRTDIVSKQKWHWNSHYNDHGIRPTSAYFIVVKGDYLTNDILNHIDLKQLLKQARIGWNWQKSRVSELFTTVTIHQRDEKSIDQFYKVFDLDSLNNKKEEDIKDVSEIKNQNSMSGSLSPSAGIKSRRKEHCTHNFETNRLELVVYSKTHGNLEHETMKKRDVKLYVKCQSYRRAYVHGYTDKDVTKPPSIMNMYRIFSLEQIDGWAWDYNEEVFNKWLPIVELSIINGKAIKCTDVNLYERIKNWRKGYYSKANKREQKSARLPLSPKHLGILYEIQFFQMYPKIDRV
jgi:hypothetical protein